ncbi:uncharacterized protein LOC131927125 [Physella acuta]|uniref:uncharacterized protein LOC131927125 n=1 Tax=Physella acuta TaxID=109671 RepID=UPI0027DD74DD|nr:uncharacterized protein LOC131927125 [Physella acuta]
MDITVQFLLSAFVIFGVFSMTKAACTLDEFQACTKDMNKVQENLGDIHLMCKFAKEVTDCYTALLPSCSQDIKDKIEMGMAQMKMMQANCQAGDSDCNIMKCMGIMGSLPQQQQSGPTQETCRIAKQASECFAEQKVKCEGNVEAKAQIELAAFGVAQMSSACQSDKPNPCDTAKFQACTNNTQLSGMGQSEDKTKNVEVCKSLMTAVECIKDAVGDCKMPALQTMVNQTLSQMAVHQAACKTMIEEHEKQNQRKKGEMNKHTTEQTFSIDDGENGVGQIRQTPFLIVTSAIALSLRAMFN